jgi:hypothetical protein
VGLAATVRLLDVHLLIADIDEGRLADAIHDVGAGWQPAAEGRLHDLRVWAAEEGSTSWCVGLGRLLERAADNWRGAGEDVRATLAYSGARALLLASPLVASTTVATAIADLDWHRNLTARACVWLERLARDFPDLNDAKTQMVEFGQQLEVLTTLVRAQRPRTRVPAAELAARGLERLRSRLTALGDVAVRSGLPSHSEAERIGLTNEVDDLSTLVATVSDDSWVLGQLAVQFKQLRDEVRFLDVVIPMGRGDHARSRGMLERADAFYDAALLAAEEGEAYLVPLVLIAADRLDEAKVRLQVIPPGMIADDNLAILALHAGDIATARIAFTRTGFDPASSRDVIDFGTAAALALGLPNPEPQTALDLALQGAEMFEAGIAGLLRNTDRVAACDSPNLAELYLLATRACVTLAEDQPKARTDYLGTAFWCIERARSLAVAQIAADAELAAAPGQLVDTWREYAAQWANETDRLLLSFDEPGSD